MSNSVFARPAARGPRPAGRALSGRFLLLAVVAGALSACGGDPATAPTSEPTDTSQSGASAAPPCPVEPVDVVVSVDQWGDITEQLAGSCARVTTIISSASVDPHDYEATPGDLGAFGDAEVVVVNGCDYDHWAEDAADGVDPAPTIVDGCEVVGKVEGDNPHIWYGPDYVPAVAQAITAALQERSPAASAYFAERAAAWNLSMQPYRDEVAAISSQFAGRTYAATESVFEYMGSALGLVDVTPEGFARAAANETEPAPADLAAAAGVLRDGGASVLVFNVQTEGAIPEQLRSTAESAGVPVVDVTETVADGAPSFVDWQVAQLRALAAALSGTRPAGR